MPSLIPTIPVSISLLQLASPANNARQMGEMHNAHLQDPMDLHPRATATGVILRALRMMRLSACAGLTAIGPATPWTAQCLE